MASDVTGINRNIMECKDHPLMELCEAGRVLIETLWNVKYVSQRKHTRADGSINRNIMECKDSMSKLFETLNDSINRNIMECKAG